MFLITKTPPKVWAIGVTAPLVMNMQKYLDYRERTWNTDREHSPLSVVEFAGRICYDSFHNPKNRTRMEYVQESIIANNHTSVLEHVWINFAVASLPRSTQLEFVRHRVGTGYSFRSTRFTDSFLEFIVPPAMRDTELEEDFIAYCRRYYADYQMLVQQLEAIPMSEQGMLKRKRIKEAARSVLPNALGSDGVVSLNIRALRHIINMRTDVHADASIREAAYAFYEAALPYVADTLVGEFSDDTPPHITL